MKSRLFSPVTRPLEAMDFRAVPVAWRDHSHGNFVGGMTAAIVSLPLCMGLGALALAPLGADRVGDGVLAGLYAAAFIGLIAILAGARGVAIYAPRSLVSFMIAAVGADLLANSPWLPRDNPQMVLAALLLLLSMAGAFQFLFGLARVSRLVKYIPTPVMAGFQNAAAISIALSQLHPVLGMETPLHLHELSASFAAMKPLTLLLSFLTLLVMMHIEKFTKRVPPLLAGLVAGTVMYYAMKGLGFSDDLGSVLGKIPVSPPDGRELASIMAITVLPGFVDALPSMMLAAASVALVASLDVLISAKVVESISGQRGNSTRELLCMGAANTVTPLLGGIIGSISLAATTANYRAGARNSMSLCIHGFLFLVLVPICAPLLGYIPKAVIGTLILFAGVGLFDRWSIQLLKRIALGRPVNWDVIAIDLAIIALVAGVAIAGEVVGAVLLGVTIGIVIFTMRMGRGFIRGKRYGDSLRSRRARQRADNDLLDKEGRAIQYLELEGPMFFASAEALHNCVDEALAEGARYVILDMSRVTELDSTGARILHQASIRMKTVGSQLIICGHTEHSQLHSMLTDHGLFDSIGQQHFFADVDRAAEWCENHLLERLKGHDNANNEFPFERLDLFRGLSPEDIAILRRISHRVEFQPGAVVFSQGEAGDALYVITRGSASVHVARTRESGDRRLVTFSPGTLFGEMALLDREMRSATVTADEALVCQVIPRETFEQLGDTHPRISMTLLANIGREISMRLRNANQAIAGTSHH